jgi:LPS export ABC transporter protein LptC
VIKSLLRILFCCLVLFFFSCSNDLSEINKLFSKDQLNIEIGKEVEILYSDSAKLKIKIEAPVLYRYVEEINPRQEFVNGVKISFYDENRNVQSVLTGKTAIRYEKKNEVIIKDSVVWQSTTEGKLETSELIWDETKSIVYSNKLVEISQPGQKITGYRFETDQNFIHWKILFPKGNLKVQDFNQQ